MALASTWDQHCLGLMRISLPCGIFQTIQILRIWIMPLWFLQGLSLRLKGINWTACVSRWSLACFWTVLKWWWFSSMQLHWQTCKEVNLAMETRWNICSRPPGHHIGKRIANDSSLSIQIYRPVYSIYGSCFGDAHLDKLRGKAVMALKLKRAGANPLLRLALSCSPTADPGYWRAQMTIRAQRRLALKEPILRSTIGFVFHPPKLFRIVLVDHFDSRNGACSKRLDLGWVVNPPLFDSSSKAFRSDRASYGQWKSGRSFFLMPGSNRWCKQVRHQKATHGWLCRQLDPHLALGVGKEATCICDRDIYDKLYIEWRIHEMRLNTASMTSPRKVLLFSAVHL